MTHAAQDAFSETVNEVEKISRFKIILKSFFWAGLSIFFLLFFTLFKLPDEKIKNYILWQISSNMNQQLPRTRLSITAEKGHFSLGLGLWYVLEGVTLSPPAPEQPIKIEEISISPHIFGLIFKNLGADFQIENQKSKLTGAFHLSSSHFSVSFKAKQIDLNKMKLVRLIATLDASGVIHGSGSLKGDFNDITQLQGDIQLSAEKVSVPQQEIGHLTFFPFTLPEINVSSLDTQITIERSKVIVKNLTLGGASGSKEAKTDDIRAKVTGEINLSKIVPSSQLDLKASFMLSERLHKQFFLLDSMTQFLTKSPNGIYGTHLTGPLFQPMPQAAQPENI